MLRSEVFAVLEPQMGAEQADKVCRQILSGELKFHAGENWFFTGEPIGKEYHCANANGDFSGIYREVMKAAKEAGYEAIVFETFRPRPFVRRLLHKVGDMVSINESGENPSIITLRL